MTPNFSAYPFDRLRRFTRREAALLSTVARWIAARPRGERLALLVGGPVRAEIGDAASTKSAGDSAGAKPASAKAATKSAGDPTAAKPAGAKAATKPASAEAATKAAAPRARAFDPNAARCEVRVRGAAFEVRGTSAAVRAIAQRVLGGPDELAAPRPLGVVERAIWALVVATALEDLAIPGDVWPILTGAPRTGDVIELAVTLGQLPLGVQIVVPSDLELRTPPPRPPAFELPFDAPIVVGRCAIEKVALEHLALRSVITLEPPHGNADLEILGGVVGLRVAQGAVVGEVTTGYVRRDMSLPDDAHVELTVSLGTTRLSLRQVCELAVGQVVSLGRPLAGPFEVRAEGRLVGRGELVDVDGELAVRIVSLGDQE